MFKKLRSNRDPEITLLSEIRKEFGHHFDKAGRVIMPFINKNPKPIFKGMVGMIVVSLVLSFTIFRNNGDAKSALKSVATSQTPAENFASDGFDQILRTSSRLKETIALKQDIELIISKKILTREDSVRLQKSLERLDHLHKSLK